jgi:hypothetical protein
MKLVWQWIGMMVKGLCLSSMEYTREKKLTITADAKTLNHRIAVGQKSYLRLADLAMDVIPGQADPRLAITSCQTHPQCNVDEARWRHWLG